MAWKRLPGSTVDPGGRGELVSVFDWWWLSVEEAPRGPVLLVGMRGDGPRTFEVDPGLWQARVRPQLEADLLAVAASLNGLGTVARQRGDWARAEAHFSRSLEALEAQIGKLGGYEEIKGDFRAQHRHFYGDAMEASLKLQLPEKAFAVLERSRARGLLAMLAERDPIFSADIPEELERTRRRIAVRHDRIQRQITKLSPAAEGEKVEVLLGDLRDLRQERDRVAEKIRLASPKLGALHYPRPLTTAQAQEALDAGTVMLSYSVSARQTDLYVLSREEGLGVFPLALGEDELRREVALLRQLIASAPPAARFESRHRQSLERVAERLYRGLVEVAERRIAPAKRLLIVPDGPLHLLPFGALIRPPAGNDEPRPARRYLVEWKPLHSVLSATVYAQLQASRPAAKEGSHPPRYQDSVQLVAFGDPAFAATEGSGGEKISNLRLRSSAARGLELTGLPSSRREVESITSLYPSSAARVYLGREATEDRAKGVGRHVRYLHFATHGILDSNLPLNSGLVLALPEEDLEGYDNGFLQAWEIFESVRLDADMVVLSACGSGLGREQGGDGLIGLTRAFHYVGARSVASSLWDVDDEIAAELMVRFYRHLRTGLTKDEALRSAQIELIRRPIEVAGADGERGVLDASAPYFWAAFQLYGGWQ